LTNINKESEKFHKIKFDNNTFNNENFTYLINDSINLILCITDNYSDLLIKEIIEYGIIQDLNLLFNNSENEIKEKIDNFFRIFFCLYKTLLINNLDYFNTLLESNRLFDILLQSYFPQENSSDLNVSLCEKIKNFTEDLIKKEDFIIDNVNNFPNIFKFLKILKDNCNLFMINIKQWKDDKNFLDDN